MTETKTDSEMSEKSVQLSSYKSKIARILSHTGILLSYSVITGAALYFYSATAFAFVRDYSDSLTTDFYVKMGFYLGILLFSVGPVLLFDKYMNGGRWVRKNIERSYKLEGDEFIATAKAIHSGQIQFYFSYAAIVLATWTFIDSINGNFNSYYKSYGQYMTMMRSSEEKNHLKAVEALVKHPDKKVADLFKKLLVKGTKKEKILTVWAIGRYEFKDFDMPEYLNKLIKETEDPKLKLTLMLALSRIEDSVSVAFAKTVAFELRKYLGDNKIPPIQLLFTAAFLRNPDYLRLYLDLFSLKNDTISVILTYAMVWLKGTLPGQNAVIVNRLNKNLKTGSRRLKCMTTVAMAFKADQLNMESLSLLRREFESKQADFKCKPEVFSLHPFKKKADTINITRLSIRGFKYPALGPVRYRERILRVLALNRDDSLIPWFKRMSENKHLSKYIRSLLYQIVSKKVRSSNTVDW